MTRTIDANAWSGVRAVLEAYLYGLDAPDPALVAACFTVDARVNYAGDIGTADSREAIMDMLEAAGAFAASNWESSHHVLANMHLTLRDDDSVESCSHVEAVLVDYPRGSGDVLRRGLRYSDRLVRIGKGWAIASRRHELLWSYRVSGAIHNQDQGYQDG